MQIPIISNESLAQMTLMQLTAYVLRLLSEALPHVENIETAETNAQASATAAEASADAASDSAAEALGSESTVETAVYVGVTRINNVVTTGETTINNAVTTGETRINAAVTNVLNTEV